MDEARFAMVPTLTTVLGVKGHRPVVGTRDCKDLLYVCASINCISGKLHTRTRKAARPTTAGHASAKGSAKPDGCSRCSHVIWKMLLPPIPLNAS